MALTVLETVSIPDLGVAFDPASALEAWVNGIQVTNIPLDSFVGSVNFVVSATSEPTPRRGMLWFKRGTGRLYLRYDAAPGNTTWSSNGDIWMQICPNHEWVGAAVGTVPKGSRVCIGLDKEEQIEAPVSYQSPIAFQPIALVSGSGDTNYWGHYGGIANDTAVSGAPVVVTEWGFVSARIASGGSDTVRGNFAKVYAFAGEGWHHPRQVAWTGETGYMSGAIIANPVTTSAVEHQAVVYQRPQTDFHWRR